MVERMAGVADALAEFGLSLDDMPVMEACGTPEEEAAFGNGAGMALDMAPEATAVIGLADGVALSISSRPRNAACRCRGTCLSWASTTSPARRDPSRR